jgi:hypothetical protein
MRPKIHESPAAKQRAYRLRVAKRQPQTSPASPKSAKILSRPRRLLVLLVEIQALADEYRAWLEAMPANLANSELAERLEDTVTLYEEAEEVLSRLDPPRGFGR